MAKTVTEIKLGLEERWKDAKEIVDIKVAVGESLSDDDVVAELNRRCNEHWEQNDRTDERQALVLAVRDVLLQLARDPDSWIPFCAHIADGNMEINMAIKVEDIDMKSFTLRNKAENYTASLRQELVDTIQDLDQVFGDDE